MRRIPLLSIAIAWAACTKDRGSDRQPAPPPVAVPADAVAMARVADAAVVAPVADAAPDADLSVPVEADWKPPWRLRRELTLPLGSPRATLAFEESGVLNGIEFRYAERDFDRDTMKGTFTITAKRGRKTLKLHHTTDAEVIVFGEPIMIEAFYSQMILRPFDHEPTNCNDAIGSIWNYLGLGTTSEEFSFVPADAQVVEKEGMYRVYYRGVRITCGTLSGRVYAERM